MDIKNLLTGLAGTTLNKFSVSGKSASDNIKMNIEQPEDDTQKQMSAVVTNLRAEQSEASDENKALTYDHGIQQEAQEVAFQKSAVNSMDEVVSDIESINEALESADPRMAETLQSERSALVNRYNAAVVAAEDKGLTADELSLPQDTDLDTAKDIQSATEDIVTGLSYIVDQEAATVSSKQQQAATDDDLEMPEFQADTVDTEGAAEAYASYGKDSPEVDSATILANRLIAEKSSEVEDEGVSGNRLNTQA